MVGLVFFTLSYRTGGWPQSFSQSHTKPKQSLNNRHGVRCRRNPGQAGRGHGAGAGARPAAW